MPLLGGPSSLCGVQPALGDAALEALDASARVHELLAPGVERVAVRAHLDTQLRARRAGDELVAARAMHTRLLVGGVDVGLHRGLILAAAKGGDRNRRPPRAQPPRLLLGAAIRSPAPACG